MSEAAVKKPRKTKASAEAQEAKAEQPMQAEKPMQPEKPMKAEKPKSAMSDFDAFSIEPTAPKAKSKSKKKIKQIDSSLKTELKLMVNCKRITKAIEKKGEVAEMRCKANFKREWATEFVRTGQVPSSVQYVDGDVSIDFVPTKRIYIKKESLEALRSIGVGIDDYLELSGVTLNFQVLMDYGMLGAAQEALKTIPGMTPEIWAQVVQKNVSPKETLYQDLVKISRESLGDKATEEELIDRMVLVTDLVNPVSQIRNPADPDSLGDAIEFVSSTELEATAEEDEKINKKKKWNDE